MASVLYVEDDKIFAEIVRAELIRAGFDVTHVLNGEDAINKAQDGGHDVVLLDIGLPKKDGFDVLETLMASENTRTTPVIMLSRLSSKEDVQQCFDLGCREYLIKSHHSPSDVVHHVQRAIGLASAFTLREALVVVLVILILGTLAWWQFVHPKTPTSVPPGNVILQQDAA